MLEIILNVKNIRGVVYMLEIILSIKNIMRNKIHMFVFLMLVLLTIIVGTYFDPFLQSDFSNWTFVLFEIIVFFCTPVIEHAIYRLFSGSKPKLRDTYFEMIIYNGFLGIPSSCVLVAVAFFINNIGYAGVVWGIFLICYKIFLAYFWTNYFITRYKCKPNFVYVFQLALLVNGLYKAVQFMSL